MSAFQQPHTQPLLKTGDSAADIRFRQLGCRCSRGKSTVFHDVREDGELVQISDPIIPHMKQYILFTNIYLIYRTEYLSLRNQDKTELEVSRGNTAQR